MKALRLSLMLAVVFAIALAGCTNQHSGQIIPDMTGPVNPWTNLEANNSSDSFQFAIAADRTGGFRPGVFAGAVKKLNLLNPEFVVCVGDLIEGYTSDAEKLTAQWDEFDAVIDKLEMPFFYTVGNHDITNPKMAEVYRQRRGRPYYYFLYKDVLFLVLCTEDGAHMQISDKQVDYFREALGRFPQARWTMVLMHNPLWLYDNPSGFPAIETALAGRPYTVIAGHHHTYTKYVRKGRSYICLATTGGGTSLRGPDYGSVDHITWVTMTDNGPRLANLELAGIHDENMMTEQTHKFVYSMPNKDLTISAIQTDGATFTSGTATLRLTNTINVPVRFSATVDTPEGIVVKPYKLEETVPVGETVLLDIALSAPAGLQAKGPSGVRVNWKAVADLEGKPQFSIQDSMAICIESKMTCSRAAGPVSLDGKLDEWGKLPFTLDYCEEEYKPVWSGTKDGSLRFALAYDDTHLYVAAKITDDEVQSDPGQLYWRQDGIEIWLDPRPKDARLSKRAGRQDRIVAGLTPGATGKDLKADIQAVSRIVDGGYTMEFSIPLKVLTDLQGASWDGLSFNIAQFDSDGETTSQLWWRPSWRSNDNYVGSGAFDRK